MGIHSDLDLGSEPVGYQANAVSSSRSGSPEVFKECSRKRNVSVLVNAPTSLTSDAVIGDFLLEGAISLDDKPRWHPFLVPDSVS